MKPELTIESLKCEAARFAAIETLYDEPSLYGVTDGKAVGTYLEQKFTAHLFTLYECKPANSAYGIDFPGFGVDVKVTSVRQPQSSCPFKSAAQKVFGLGYHLLVFVYDKVDDHERRTGRLNMRHTIFVEQSRTGDYQTSRGLLEILARNGNHDDVLAFLQERNLPLDDIAANELAERILREPPNQGFLTISNALQWRLQYGRIIQQADTVEGIKRIR